jgi:p38 MAP kinase
LIAISLPVSYRYIDLIRTSNRPVAIKLMKGIFDEPTDAKRAYREMHILRHLRHPSVVSLLNVIVPDRPALPTTLRSLYHSRPTQSLGNLYLVFELVDTDLAKVPVLPHLLRSYPYFH